MNPGELLVVGYEGVAPPAALLARIAAGRVGGVVLFARNVGTPVETAAAIRAIAGATPLGAPPLVVAVDQEGGRVQRLREPLTRWPSMLQVAAKGDANLTESVGEALGAELRLVGFNVDFAPVLDVNSNPANPVIGDRSFGATPDVVAVHALAFWRGLERAGLRGCGKHFPGHGDTTTDSHLELPLIDRPRASLDAVELVPFRAAVAAGVRMIMTAHVVYAALDGRPATMSDKLLGGVLRGELGFDGVIVSDDLDMKAVAERWPTGEVIASALTAGVDMFLACRDPRRQIDVEEALVRAAGSPELGPRVASALARARAFRRTLSPAQPVSDEELSARVPDRAHLALAARCT